MAIKIQTKQTGIPVEFGELNFVFDTSDESIKHFNKEIEVIQKKLEKIDTSKEDTEEDVDRMFDEAKDYLGEGFNLMLGKGAFDKIYEQTPSVLNLIEPFVELAEGIKEELSALGVVESQKELGNKYLAKKTK